MARFFRTTNATPIDYMYQLNIPLMEKVLEVNDKYITNTLDTADKANTLANFNYLPQDAEEASKVIGNYKQKVKSITDAIRADPANWKSQQGAITQLTSDLTNDYTSGAISKYTGNYNLRKKYQDDVDSQVKLWNESGGTKGVSPERAAAYKTYWDSSFEGTNYDSNMPSKYNTYKGGQVMSNLNIPKILEDGLDKIKADKSNMYEERPDGAYFLNKVTQKMERITPEKVLQVATGNITPEMLTYLRNDAQVGLVDPNSITTPYTTAGVPISPQEQANIDYLQDKVNKSKGDVKTQLQKQLDDYNTQLKTRGQIKWNNDSYFTPTLRKLAEQYSYENIESGNDLSTNEPALAQYREGQTNARQARSLMQAAQFHKESMDAAKEKFDFEKQKHADDLAKDARDEAWRKYAHDNPAAKAGVTVTKPGAKTNTSSKPAISFPTTTGVSKLSTRDFNSWLTNDANTNAKVPVISNAGLSSDIDMYRGIAEEKQATIKDINNQLLSSSLSSAERDVLNRRKNNAELDLQQANKELSFRRTLYKQGMEAALTGNVKAGTPLSQTELDIYHKYEGDRDGTKALAEAEELIHPSSPPRYGGKKWDDLNTEERLKYLNQSIKDNEVYNKNLEKAYSIRNDVAQYKKVKRMVDNNRETYYTNMRNSPISTDAIATNAKDSKDVADIILSNPRGTRIYNELGASAEGTKIDGSTNMTFAGGSLQEYMDKTGTTMNVHNLGNSNSLGDGNAVAEVTFNDPTGNIAAGRKFYISLDNNLQNTIGNKFRAYPSAVADVANSMLDQESNYIRKQMIQPSAKNSINAPQTGEPFTYDITVPINGRTVPLKVTRFSESNGQDSYMITKTVNGKPVPLPRLTISSNKQIVEDPSAVQGRYFGIEDFINQLKLDKLRR